MSWSRPLPNFETATDPDEVLDYDSETLQPNLEPIQLTPLTNVSPTDPILTPLTNVSPTHPILTPLTDVSPTDPILTPLTNVSPTDPILTPLINVSPTDPILTPLIHVLSTDPILTPLTNVPPTDPILIPLTNVPPTDSILIPLTNVPPTDPILTPLTDVPPTDPILTPLINVLSTDPILTPLTNVPPTDPILKPLTDVPPTDPILTPLTTVPPPVFTHTPSPSCKFRKGKVVVAASTFFERYRKRDPEPPKARPRILVSKPRSKKSKEKLIKSLDSKSKKGLLVPPKMESMRTGDVPYDPMPGTSKEHPIPVDEPLLAPTATASDYLPHADEQTYISPTKTGGEITTYLDIETGLLVQTGTETMTTGEVQCDPQPGTSKEDVGQILSSMEDLTIVEQSLLAPTATEVNNFPYADLQTYNLSPTKTVAELTKSLDRKGKKGFLIRTELEALLADEMSRDPKPGTSNEDNVLLPPSMEDLVLVDEPLLGQSATATENLPHTQSPPVAGPYSEPEPGATREAAEDIEVKLLREELQAMRINNAWLQFVEQELNGLDLEERQWQVKEAEELYKKVAAERKSAEEILRCNYARNQITETFQI